MLSAVVALLSGLVLENVVQLYGKHLAPKVLLVWEVISNHPASSAAIFVTLLLIGLHVAFSAHWAPPMDVDMGVEDVIDMRGRPQDDRFQVRDKDEIVCFSPSTGHEIMRLPVDDKETVEECVKRARAAQAAWSKTSFAERRSVLRLLLRAVRDNAEDICRVSSLDTGKTRMEGMLGEIMVSLEKLTWVCTYGEEVLAPEHRPTSLPTLHKEAKVMYEPLGVIGVLAPWNYPFHNMLNHVCAIFCGNAVVVKMSEYSALSAELYARLFQSVLIEAGHSPDLVQIVQGFGETGAALVESSVDKVIFTGSPGIGRLVARGASKCLTPCVLELGGKDPIVVTDDVVVSEVVQAAVRGALQNAGQNCIGLERFYVYDEVYDEFVDKIVDIVSKVRVGPPLHEDGSWNEDVDMGSLTTLAQLEHVEELVEDAVENGATIEFGGKALRDKAGIFFQPTILTGVTHDMRIANEEVFGPVITIIRVSGGDEEAISMVNSTQYGLGSNVFCRDLARANAFAARIRAGMVNVNDFALNYMVQGLPFGGVGESGYGRFSGHEGLRAYCHMKSITTDLFPGVRTQLPPPMHYPTSNKSLNFLDGLLDLMYATDLWHRFTAIFKLV